jgi:hypothetical protein
MRIYLPCASAMLKHAGEHGNEATFHENGNEHGNEATLAKSAINSKVYFLKLGSMLELKLSG